jgi:Phage integrase family
MFRERVRVRRSITQVGGRLVEGNPKSDARRRSVAISEPLVPALKTRLDARPPAGPAIASQRSSRLGLANWKRAVDWKAAVAVVRREEMRVHGLRHTYASLSRRAGADLLLLQKAMGHAPITVTAHNYADLSTMSSTQQRHRTRLARRLQFGYLTNMPLAAVQFWPHRDCDLQILDLPAPEKLALSYTNLGGQGRDRTGDLPLFRRTLIPTELPGRKAPTSYPSASPKTGDPDGT